MAQWSIEQKCNAGSWHDTGLVVKADTPEGAIDHPDVRLGAPWRELRAVPVSGIAPIDDQHLGPLRAELIAALTENRPAKWVSETGARADFSVLPSAEQRPAMLALLRAVEARIERG